jgi:hypothetical protein
LAKAIEVYTSWAFVSRVKIFGRGRLLSL